MPYPEKIYQAIANRIQSINNCIENNNVEWLEKHKAKLYELVKNQMPSGSGFNNGTGIAVHMSDPNRLVFFTSFHHMNDCGFYDGWTEHKVIVTPDLSHGFNLRITGRDRNEIKDYIHEVFDYALRKEITIE